MSEPTPEGKLSEEASQLRRWLWARFVNLLPPPSERVVTLHDAPEDPPADWHVYEILHGIRESAQREEREQVALLAERWAHELQFNPAGLPLTADYLRKFAAAIRQSPAGSEGREP